jgi:hypothetical protein
MPIEEILKLLRKRPFVPFRIYLMDGTSFEIRHQETVITGRHSLHLGLKAEPPDFIYERSEIISLIAISRLEQIEAPAPVQGNSPDGPH